MKIKNAEGPTVSPDGRPLDEQPKWRQDFPIDWPQDEYVSRRDMVKFLVLTSAAFTAGHAWLAVKSAGDPGPEHVFEPRAIAPVDDVPVGGAMVFRFPEGSAPRILVRVTEERFVAYDQQCTHLLCPVVPKPRDGKLHCPCHNGWFDLESGRPLAGPPRRPLPRVTVEVRDGVVWAVDIAPEAT